jgi:hypothetical protein
MSGRAAGGPLDASGCLSAAGLAALTAAPVGQAPPQLASHLAGCVRCQDRLLFLSAGATTGARQPSARPAPWRNLALVTAGFVLILVVLGVALGMLSGSR